MPSLRPARSVLSGAVLPLVAALLLAAPLPALAQATVAPDTGTAGATASGAEAVQDLSAALRIGDVLAVMRDEGLDYGKSLEADMFPGAGGAAWAAKVAAVYDADRMARTFTTAFAEALRDNPATAKAATAFFAAPLGQRIISLEIEARRALLEEAAEDAATLAWAELEAEDDPRAALIRRFAEVNDLVESNVTGALNANLAFYRGLAGAGAFGDMPQEDMLAEVWAQEESVRAETEDWLYPYLALAYRPLSDEDLTAYTDFSATPEGQRLNRALFSAFAALFDGISEQLGQAAAIQLQGQDI